MISIKIGDFLVTQEQNLGTMGHQALPEHIPAFTLYSRAENNGQSTDNVRPDRRLDRSNSGLAGHFDRSFLDTNILFSIQLSLNAL